MSDPEIDLVSGTALDMTFLTDQGWMIVSADLRRAGRVLHLDAFAIEPLHTKALKMDADQLYAMRREIEENARNQGYNQIELHGVRRSGANPNRIFHYARRLG